MLVKNRIIVKKRAVKQTKFRGLDADYSHSNGSVHSSDTDDEIMKQEPEKAIT